MAAGDGGVACWGWSVVIADALVRQRSVNENMHMCCWACYVAVYGPLKSCLAVNLPQAAEGKRREAAERAVGAAGPSDRGSSGSAASLPAKLLEREVKGSGGGCRGAWMLLTSCVLLLHLRRMLRSTGWQGFGPNMGAKTSRGTTQFSRRPARPCPPTAGPAAGSAGRPAGCTGRAALSGGRAGGAARRHRQERAAAGKPVFFIFLGCVCGGGGGPCAQSPAPQQRCSCLQHAGDSWNAPPQAWILLAVFGAHNACSLAPCPHTSPAPDALCCLPPCQRPRSQASLCPAPRALVPDPAQAQRDAQLLGSRADELVRQAEAAAEVGCHCHSSHGPAGPSTWLGQESCTGVHAYLVVCC